MAITRRDFLATSAAGTGLGLLTSIVPTRNILADTGTSSITSNFNGTPILPGSTIWFTSVIKVQGLGSDPVTLGFTGNLSYTVDGTPYFVPTPSAVITFSPTVDVATTIFCNGTWITDVPLQHLSGNLFLAGFALQVPDGFPSGVKNITWQGSFYSLAPGLRVQWQWAAAVYTNFSLDYNALGVKPVDDSHASDYHNSDHAGTPENFKSFVTGGARGGGGSNFTGSYSGTAATTPAEANAVANCGGGSS